jgi:hypothetical protein
VIQLIRKIHIYAGVLTFAHLAIYGAAGIVATFQAGPERSKTPRAVRFLPFKPAPSATDKEVAGAVYEAVKPPLSRPVPDWFLQHTPDNKLLLDFYNINGIYRVIVLEDQSLLRVEEIRNSVWLFLEDVHAATLRDEDAPALIRAWAVWNEAAMWSLLAFCVSGVFLWLGSRPRFQWAWGALAAGLLSFAYLYARFRQ